MRISYEKYPVLKFLEQGMDAELKVYNDEDERLFNNPENNALVTILWNAMCKFLRKENIYLFSKLFIDCYKQASNRLYHSFLWENVVSGNYLFLLPNGKSTYLRVDNHLNERKIILTSLSFYNNCIVGISSESVDYNIIGTIKRSGSIQTESKVPEILPELSSDAADGDTKGSHSLHCLLLILFVRYANIETKILPPNTKSIELKCKYLNETNASVTIYNNTWFTNLIKSDSFKVSGHFRLQPCGDGMKDRKLIWIKDFVKNGYTAPARKLKTENI